ncbi:MAG: PEP-CTERM/exosortase system-associated acyltransferase [Candidatus Rokuibacteriota bacterium]|nr:MAG: PEP-CTERM/exosortase system-associated acyltransferase [Candidatus Rokubacteria bacterium]
MAVVEKPAQPSRYFDFARVGMDEPRWADVQRLRYDVYCLECQFLDAAKYPDGLESDEFDPHSIQFAAFNSEHEAVATLRLVRDGGLGFPLEHHVDSLLPAFNDLPRDRTAEISRLILAKRYRRRANDGRYGTGGVGPATQASGGDPNRPAQRRSPYPLILFGLFGQMLQESLGSGLQYWLAVMEPWLQTFLARFGFAFTPVGKPIEYFGEVVPYGARIEDITSAVSSMKPEVWQILTGKNGDS